MSGDSKPGAVDTIDLEYHVINILQASRPSGGRLLECDSPGRMMIPGLEKWCTRLSITQVSLKCSHKLSVTLKRCCDCPFVDLHKFNLLQLVVIALLLSFITIIFES